MSEIKVGDFYNSDGEITQEDIQYFLNGMKNGVFLKTDTPEFEKSNITHKENFRGPGFYEVLKLTLISGSEVPDPTSYTELTNNNTITWTWTKIDGAVKYLIKINEESKNPVTTEEYTISNLTDGLYKISVASENNAGIISNYGTHTVEVDSTAPDVPAPTTTTPTSDTTPTWTWQPIDDAVLYGVKLNTGSETTQTPTSYTPNTLSEGTHTLYVRAKDNAGIWSAWGEHTIVIDTTAPGVPSPTTTTPTMNTTPTWTWNSVTDAVEYDVKLNEVSKGSQTETSYKASTLTDGTHTISVRAKDAVGNYSAWGEHTIEIDSTAPGVPSPTTTTPTMNTTPTWTWNSVTDAVEYDVKLNEVSKGSQTETSYKASTLTDGTHTISVRAKDAVGNYSAWGEHTIVIDTTAPGVPSPTTTTPTMNTTPTWTWNSVTDAVEYDVKLNEVSKGSQTETSYKASTLTDGTHTISVRAKDAVGNYSAWGEHTIVIDTTAPGVPSPTTTTPTMNTTPTWTWNSVTDAVEYDVKLNEVSKGSQTETSYKASTLTDGTHTISVRAKDAVGNYSAWGEHTIVIDTTAPGVPSPTTTTPTMNTTPTWTWNSVTDAVEYDVKLNEVSKGSQTETSYKASTLTDGTHTISVRAKDAVGNYSAWGEHTIEIDSTAPGVPSPTTTTPTMNTTPTWTWNSVTDAVEYDVKLNEVSKGSQTETSYKASTLTDGTHTISVRAKDAVGNYSAWGEHTIVIDTTAPGVPSPTTTTPTMNTTPTWTWNSVTDAVEYDVKLNEVSKGSQTETSYKASTLTDGTHTISVRAKDAVGNYSAWGEHTIEIDSTAPSNVQITNNDPITGTAPNITWSGHNEEIDYYIINLTHNDDLMSEYPKSTTEQHYQVPDNLPDGTYTITVTATDKLGNINDGHSYTFTIDTTAPDVPAPSPTTTTTNTTPTWIWKRVTDAVNYEVNLNGESKGSQTGNSYTAPTLQNGEYTISVIAIDVVGNRSVAGTHTLTINADGDSENAEFTLNTSKVADMRYMFSGCSSLVELNATNWNTSAVKEMDYMFNACSSLTFVDLGKWDVSNTTGGSANANGMTYMFNGCSSLDNNGVNFSKWCVSQYTDEPRNFRTGGVKFVEKPDWGFACDPTKAPGPISAPPYDYIELKYDRNIASAIHDVNTSRQRIYLPFTDYGTGTTIEWADGNVTYKEGVIAFNNTTNDSDTTILAYPYDAGSTITIKVYGDVKKFLGATGPTNTTYRNNMIWHSNTALKSVKIVGMSSITDCQKAFANAINLQSVDLTEFDSSNVINMDYMFYKCSSIETLNLSNQDVSNITDFGNFFDGCTALTDLNITTWKTTEATAMNHMFRNCSDLPYIAPSSDENRATAEFTLNTSKVADMRYMFSGCSSLVKLHPTNWDTSAVEEMNYMFNACSSLTFVDLAEWDVNAISYTSEPSNGMTYMFNGCSSLDNDSVNFSKWCVSQFEDEPRNFRTGGVKFVEKPDWGFACDPTKAPGPISAPPYDYIELKYDRNIASAIHDVNTSRQRIYLPFTDYGTGTTIEWADGNVTYKEGVIAFNNTTNDSDTTILAYPYDADSTITIKVYGDVKKFLGATGPTNTTYRNNMIWHSNTALKSVKIVGMSSITDCQKAFANAINLQSVDLTEFDSSNVINMDYMFYKCSSIETLNLSNQDVSNITDFGNFFDGCTALTDLNITTWKTTEATAMNHMFRNCSDLPYIAPSSDENRATAEFTLNTSKVADMRYMFSGCSSLVKLHPTNWDTSAVEEMNYMFNACSSLTFVDLAEWDVNAISYTSEPSNGMTYMFNGCSSLDNDSVNFSKWCVSQFEDEPRNFRTGGVKFVEKPDWGFACDPTKAPGPISAPPYDYIELKYDRNIASAIHDVNTSRQRIYLPFTDYGTGTTIEWADGNVTYKEGVIAFNNTTNDSDTTILAYPYDADSTITIKVYGDVKKFLGATGPTNTTYRNNMIWHSNTALKSVKIVGMSSITDCQKAFANAINLQSVDLTEFDSSNVINMDYMFYKCSSIETLNLSNQDVSNITDFGNFFDGCTALTDLNITTWKTTEATAMNHMFRNCSDLPYIAPSSDENRATAEFTLNTSKVADMRYMFSGCSSLVKLHPTNWDTSAVEEMNYMFNACSSLTFVDLAEWDVNAISYTSEPSNGMTYMFNGCSSLDNDSVNFSKWCVSQFEDEPRNFRTGGVKFVEKPDWGFACDPTKAPGPISAPPYDYIELKYDRNIASAIHDVNTSRQRIYLPFTDYGTGTTIEWADGNVTYKEGVIAFNNTTNDSDTTILAYPYDADSTITIKVYGDVKKFLGATGPTNTTYRNNMIWHSNTALKSVKIVGMSSITDCQKAFANAINLQSVDLTEFDSSNVINMDYMFYKCSSIETLNLSNQDVSNITDFGNFFDGCTALTDLNITTWKTTEATAMNHMFRNCSDLPYIAPSSDENRATAEFTLNTSKVADMRYMFSGCSSLVKLHPTNWDTSAVEEMNYMFNACSSLTFVDLAEWDVNAISYTSEPSNGMTYMFNGCSSLDNDSVNFSKWCVSQFEDEPRNFRTGGVKFVEKPDWGFACDPTKAPGPISAPPYDYIELKYDRNIASAIHDVNTSRQRIYLPFTDYGTGTTIEWADGNVTYKEGVIAFNNTTNDSDTTILAYPYDADSTITIKVYGDVKKFLGATGPTNTTYRNNMIWHSNTALKSVKIVGMSSITDCQKAFANAINLQSVDLTEFDSSNVINMDYMFYKCSTLTLVDFSGMCVTISQPTNFNSNAGFNDEPTWEQSC